MDYKKQGENNRAAGQRFELKVRKDLEYKGWIVDRWSNNVDFNWYDGMDKIGKDPPGVSAGRDASDFSYQGKLIKAKSFMGRSRTNGFPDFIAFRIRILSNVDSKEMPNNLYEVIGVEVKSNGYLDKTEKEKCTWLLENNIFSKILIAKKGKKRGEIEYKEFV